MLSVLILMYSYLLFILIALNQNQVPACSHLMAFSCTLLLGVLIATDKLVTLVSPLTRSVPRGWAGGGLGSRGISLAFYV